jgi:hypothetical protein
VPTKPIAQTGLKGFLLWLKQDQPGIYQATAAAIAKAAPKGFSNYNASVVTRMRKSQGRRSMAQFGSLGDDSDSMLQSVSFDSSDSSLLPDDISYAPDTSTVANSGTTDAATLNSVANIINSVAGAALGEQQQQTYSQLVNAQLARAQQGTNPLVLSSRTAGIPLLGSLTSSSGGLLVLGIGAVVLLALLGGRGGARAHASVSA